MHEMYDDSRSTGVAVPTLDVVVEAWAPTYRKDSWDASTSAEADALLAEGEERGTESASTPSHTPSHTPFRFSLRRLLVFTGPGFLMSIAYLDPGNIESDLQAGAQASFSLLWVLALATLVGLLIQLLAARLGVVTGKHLAEHCRDKYSGATRIVLWLMAEVAIIGSDIQEVIGSAYAINLLSHGYVPLWVGVLVTALDTFTFLFLERYGIRYLEVFFGFLIAVMGVSFGMEYVISSPDQVDVVKGLFIPHVPSGATTLAVAMLGAVVMPHNIFLHSALVQSRKIDTASSAAKTEANIYYAIESSAALFLSFLINMFVVCVFASSFHGTENADDIGLSVAGQLLGDKYGRLAYYVWAVGLLAAGQSSTMTGTYAGQFVMQGFLDLKISAWKRILITRSAAIAPSIIVALAAKGQLDTLDEYLNVLQSIQLPFAIIPVTLFTSSVSVMGSYVNPFPLQVLVWCILALVLAINSYLVLEFVRTSLPPVWWVYMTAASALCVYVLFIAHITVGWYVWPRVLGAVKTARTRHT